MHNELIVCLAALFLLAGCEEDKCQYYPKSSKNYTEAFDHCMDKAAVISKSGTHDNSYNTIEECRSYASSIDTAICREEKK